MSHVSSTAGRCAGPENTFENYVYSWILNRHSQRRMTRGLKLQDEKASTILLALMSKLKRRHDSELAQRALRKFLRGIAVDFQAFFNEIGITHYVSAIELGAMKYSVSTLTTHQTKVGIGAELEAVKHVRGGISGVKEIFSFFQSKEEQEIGRIEACQRNTAGEAVIGFQIQPIYKLVRIPFLQYVMRKLMKEYIVRKTDKICKFSLASVVLSCICMIIKSNGNTF